jgi:GDP-L-fucose synthase
MRRNSRIFIVGHNDSVDNSLKTYFKSRGFTSVFSNTANKIDLLNQNKLERFFKDVRPEYIFLGSIRSGGIVANQKQPAEFIYENLQAQTNVIHAAHVQKAKKLLYFTGSCAYPKEAKQPIKEESLLTGPLEETSEAYSVAKIAGTKMCQAYRRQYGFNAIVGVPATLYGPGSDSDLEKAHVMGALIAKFAKATKENADEVIVWGSGKPRREFLYVDDFVEACIVLMENYDSQDLVNIGVGHDVTIKELALILKRISGFKGKISFDSSKPDGTMRKLMDNSRIKKLGWKPKISLEEGIAQTYQWYRKEVS